MNSSLYFGLFDKPESIATKADLDALDHIPPRICRDNATKSVAPTSTELKGISPDNNEITTVILTDGTEEIWQYNGSWSVKLTIEPGADGAGGFSVSKDDSCVVNMVGTNTAGVASSASIFDDGSRAVTAVNGRSDHLASGCARECEIVYDVADNSYWIIKNGAYTTHSTPTVSVFVGALDADDFIPAYKAHGNAYCSNYHKCYAARDCIKFCITSPITGTHTINVTNPSGDDYTVVYGSTTVNTPSGTDTTLNLNAFSGSIKVYGDYGNARPETSLPLPQVMVCC